MNSPFKEDPEVDYMKYYFRFSLYICTLLLLLSCSSFMGKNINPSGDRSAAARIKGGKYKIKLERMKVEPENKGSGRRGRRPFSPDKNIQKTEIKKEEATKNYSDEQGNGTAVEKNRTIFTPYSPPLIAPDKIEIVEAKEGSERIEGQEIGPTEGLTPDGFVTLNFQDAPIEEIINTVSEALGMNYILGPNVKGKITMQTSQPVPVHELFQILQSVLKINGFTLVISGRYFKVIAAKEATHYPLAVISGKGAAELPEEETFITQIIPLDYIPVKEMLNVLKPFLSKPAPNPLQHEELNLLILNDTAANMKRLLKFVQELDKPLYQPKEKVFVYYVENGDAKEIAQTLNDIYKKRSTKKNNKKFPIIQPPIAPPGATRRGAAKMPIYPPYFTGGEEVEGEVIIVAAEYINALIITTSPRNYPAVLEIVKKLDIQPRQVLVEVLIAEIKMDNIKEFGLDWALQGKAGNNQSYRFGADLGGGISNISNFDSINWASRPGINYLLAKQDKFFALLNNKIAEDKFNVLSSPHIMASDNEKAIIEIIDQYPIPRDTYDANNNKSTTYDYKDAGIKLEFTPKINKEGLVTLKLIQEVSQLQNKDTEQGTYEFSKRRAETSVVVHDGETLIIGGLVKEQKTKSKIGFPLLSDIPIIGYLFSHTSEKIIKTQLIILITPHVIRNEIESQEITKKFQGRVKELKNKIDKSRYKK